MQNFKKDQQIPLVQVTDPNTGQTYYAPQNVVYDEKNNNGPQYLRNVIVDQAVSASYFSGSITNAISASYAATASYVLGSIASASFATSASYALTASYVSGSVAAPGATTQVVFNNGGVLSANSGLVYSGSSLGINNSSPQSGFRLDVGGNTVTRGALYVQNDLYFFGPSNSNIRISGLRFTDLTTSTTQVNISTTGNLGIGIGTTTASSRLQVRGSGATSATTALRVENSNASASLIVLDNGSVYSYGPKFITSNTAFGAGAHNALDSGSNNTAFGVNAHLSLTNGRNNVGVGLNANRSITIADNNTAVGYHALYNNVTGSNNTAVGVSALQNNLTVNNVAIGGYTLFNTTIGGFNTALGYSSLFTNVNGSANVSIGYASFYNLNTGSENVSLGNNAGRYIAPSTSPLSSSGESIFIGSNARANANGETNQIVIGVNANGLGSNTVVLGNSSITRTALQGNVSIGTTGSINSTLYISGSGRFTNGLTVTGSFISPSITGSLLGTASYATTAAYALDHAPIANTYICNGYLSSDQIFTTGSDEIIRFERLDDPNNWLTGNQFTPTVAGYYHIDLGVWLDNPGTTSNQVNAQMRKNGNTHMIIQQPLNNTTGQTLAGSKLIYLDGSTDYLDFTIFQAAGSSSTGTLLQGTPDGSGTWFSAFLVTQ